MKEDYLTVADIARLLKVSPATAYKISHRIGCLKLGPGPRAPLRIRVEDYERWVSESRQESRPGAGDRG